MAFGGAAAAGFGATGGEGFGAAGGDFGGAGNSAAGFGSLSKFKSVGDDADVLAGAFAASPGVLSASTNKFG